MTYDDETGTEGAGRARKEPTLLLSAELTVFPKQMPDFEGIGSEVTPPVDPVAKRVKVGLYMAACERNDHDPALGGFLPNGTWNGNEFSDDSGPAQDQAQAQVNAHVEQTGHGEAMVTTWIETFFVGPVL